MSVAWLAKLHPKKAREASACLSGKDGRGSEVKFLSKKYIYENLANQQVSSVKANIFVALLVVLLRTRMRFYNLSSLSCLLQKALPRSLMTGATPSESYVVRPLE